MDVKEIIADKVGTGKKGVELVTDVAKTLVNECRDIPNIPRLLDEMVAAGELVEVEYTEPSTPNRIKSFYLPAGSTVRVKW